MVWQVLLFSLFLLLEIAAVGWQVPRLSLAPRWSLESLLSLDSRWTRESRWSLLEGAAVFRPGLAFSFCGDDGARQDGCALRFFLSFNNDLFHRPSCRDRSFSSRVMCPCTRKIFLIIIKRGFFLLNSSYDSNINTCSPS